MLSPTQFYPLLNHLSNDYLLRQTSPYLLPHEIVNLARCSKKLYGLLFHTAGIFRHVDLSLSSTVEQVQQPVAIALRHKYTDILSSHVLARHTQTLILDGRPMNFDMLFNLLISENQRIAILSVRDCGLNQPRFMQVLHYLVQSEKPRPLKGVYMFGKSNGGARSKNIWQRKGAGEVEFIDGWAETLQACEGKILFDVGLCRGPKHLQISNTDDEELAAAASEIVLGSTPVSVQSGFASFVWSGADSEQSSVTSASGSDDWVPPQMAPKLATKRIQGNCHGCGAMPAGCSSKLYGPVPVLTSDIKVASRPRVGANVEIDMCEDCVKDRLCACCGNWWCEQCFSVEYGKMCGIAKGGVLLDCYDCGRTCFDCKKATNKKCGNCKTNFCAVHDVGGSDKYCDWCHV